MRRGNDFDGTLIAVEGLDGAGKSTVVEAIERFLDNSEDAVPYTVTAEPTASPAGLVAQEAASAHTARLHDFFAFLADRAHHIESTIRPALADGEVVVTDRYADSTRAYQTRRVAKGLDESAEKARRFVDEVMAPWVIEPDLTLYLRLTPSEAAERAEGDDKYEDMVALEAAYEAYESLYGRCDAGVRIIDAARSKQTVEHYAVNAVRSAIEDRRASNNNSGAKTYREAVEDFVE